LGIAHFPEFPEGVTDGIRIVHCVTDAVKLYAKFFHDYPPYVSAAQVMQEGCCFFVFG
jgi:hypothetical protein